MPPVLILIDLQNDYFPGGKMPLAGIEEAVGNAARLLTAFRRHDRPVIHVQHLALEPQAPFFVPHTPGAEIHAQVQPENNEPVICKHTPNSFKATDLQARLRALASPELVFVGAMSHMCIDASVRAAGDLGFDCTVAHDACATRDLTFEGRMTPARLVHGAFMAALASAYARVSSTAEILTAL